MLQPGLRLFDLSGINKDERLSFGKTSYHKRSQPDKKKTTLTRLTMMEMFGCEVTLRERNTDHYENKLEISRLNLKMYFETKAEMWISQLFQDKLPRLLSPLN